MQMRVSAQKLLAVWVFTLCSAFTLFSQNDLSLSVSTTSGTVAIGDTVTFTITVNNQGATTVSGVQVTNLLPSGVSFVSATPGAGTYNPVTHVWNIGGISGATSSVSLTLKVLMTGEGVQTLRSNITAMTEYDGDSDPSDNSPLEDDYSAACVTVPFTFCTGQIVDITATAPAGYAGYQWYKNGAPISGATSQTYNITEAGLFNFTVNGGPVGSCGAGGCCDIVVTELTPPSAGITNNTGTTVLTCNTPTISLTATGGASYLWSDAGATTTANLSVTTPGTYTVTVTASNGCTATSQVVITQDITPPTAGITNNTGTTVLTCTTTSISLTATGGGTYLWSDAGATTTANLSVTTPGTYTVTVTASNGCTATSQVVITQDITPPTAGITNNTGTTVLTCTTTSISLTATGGGTYLWSDAGATTTANLSVTTPDTYTVTVTASNGCTATSQVVITQDITPPTAGITNNTGTTVLTCTTTSISLTATGGGTYLWSDAGATTTANLSVTTQGTYTVTVTAANGCTASAQVVITQDTTPPSAGITNNTGSTEITCVRTSISLTATGGVSYLWSTTETTASISVTTADTYTVTVTGSNGCTSTAQVIITGQCTVDYADLPDLTPGTGNGDYQTLAANNGPSHGIIAGLSLGTLIDAETDGQPTAGGDGDDNNGVNDDDGVIVGPTYDIVPGGTIRVPVTVTNTTGNTAYLVAWIDWNGDGDFDDAGEQVVSINDGGGSFPAYLTIAVPGNATTGVDIGFIVRLSNTLPTSPGGYLNSGEVESFVFDVNCPSEICLPVETTKN